MSRRRRKVGRTPGKEWPTISDSNVIAHGQQRMISIFHNWLWKCFGGQAFIQHSIRPIWRRINRETTRKQIGASPLSARANDFTAELCSYVNADFSLCGEKQTSYIETDLGDSFFKCLFFPLQMYLSTVHSFFLDCLRTFQDAVPQCPNSSPQRRNTL